MKNCKECNFNFFQRLIACRNCRGKKENQSCIKLKKYDKLKEEIKKKDKFNWFKLKNPDRLDRWSIGHFGLGMIAGMLAVVNPYIGFTAFNLILLWEFIEYWLSQKVDAEKYWLDPAGISLTDMCLDCLGFAVVLIFSGVFNWRV
ncbi:MAG: hypothetical protein GY714_20750 [Desulfobacterales bacterium]|nr:hypothetical protein [Desulfobacterales bacterium]